MTTSLNLPGDGRFSPGLKQWNSAFARSARIARRSPQRFLAEKLVIFEEDVSGLAENFSSEALKVGFWLHAHMAAFTAFF